MKVILIVVLVVQFHVVLIKIVVHHLIVIKQKLHHYPYIHLQYMRMHHVVQLVSFVHHVIIIFKMVMKRIKIVVVTHPSTIVDSSIAGSQLSRNTIGVSCSKCNWDGASCQRPIDCTSGYCWYNQCVRPNCTNGIQDGNETGIGTARTLSPFHHQYIANNEFVFCCFIDCGMIGCNSRLSSAFNTQSLLVYTCLIVFYLSIGGPW
jgi:hypothetical protein